jgi:hypothetical protein
VAVRLDVSPAHHDVQKAVRVVVLAHVKVVIGSQPRRLGSPIDQRPKKLRI